MKATERVEAQWMGSVFGTDPNLTMPERPRVPPEIHVTALGGDGLLFAGAEELQVVRGASARQLLPQLISVLDGTRTLDEVCAAVPDVPAKHVRDAIALLKSRGLIEDGVPRPTPPGLEDVGAFLGRIIDVSRTNRDRHEALARLSAARVVIAGDRGAAAALTTTLRACGVGEIAAWTGLDDVSLVIAVGPDPATDDIVAAAFAARIPVLPVTLSEAEVRVGPLLASGRSCCPACQAAASGEPGEATVERDHVDFLLEHAALRVFHLLAGTALVTDHRSALVFGCERATGELCVEARPMPRTPGCRGCGLGDAAIAPDDDALVAWRFHSTLEMPPKELQGKRDYQMHFRVANVQLAQQPAEGYDGAPALALPVPIALAVPAPWTTAASPGAGRLDLDAVATLVGRANGFVATDGGTRRVAPTGGNLGSPALYVAAIDVEGLAPALYYYHPTSHVLERIDDIDVAALAAALGDPGELPACVVLGAARLGKVYQKYREFAYRVVHFDAGVAIGYLHAIAAALGLPACELPDLDDAAVADLLQLPTAFGDYLPTFAIGFGRRVAVTAGPPVTVELAVGAADLADATMWKLIRASRSPRRPAGVPAEQTPRFAGTPTTAFERTLLARHAVRDYAETPVPRDRLREVVALAIDVVRERVAAGAAPIRLVPWVAVRVGGGELEAGLYEGGEAGELVLRRRGLSAGEALRLNSQDNLAGAPVSIFMAVDLDHALATRGARGYREACEMAGAAVGRAWLAAVSLGLGGCAGGGVIPTGLRELADVDGFTRCPILSFHLGVPR